jgi:DNA-binding HxlR family transcriptional regulator
VTGPSRTSTAGAGWCSLTPLGATLHETVEELVVWTGTHQSEIASARAEYDIRATATG